MNPQQLDWKVIIGAIGLLGLAVYQFSVGEYAGGVQSVLAAIAAFGVKKAFDNNSYLLQMQNKQLLALRNPHAKFDDDGNVVVDEKCASEEKK